MEVIKNSDFSSNHPQTLDPTGKPKPGPSPGPEKVRYRECRRNHAAHLGGQVVDGCGEFMAAGREETPLAFRCAACDCHRNFHRREVDGDPPPLQPPPPPTTTTANCYISFSKPQKLPTSRPVMVAFGGGGGVAPESSSEDLTGGHHAGKKWVEQNGLSKKRFRTKFTEEQKVKMMKFAEKLGWKIQKQDKAELQRFCEEVGIKRQVFKVWMHNNKQAMKRSKQS